MQFLLGPRNTALVLVVLEAVILIGLFFGFYLMRFRRDRKSHEKNQTTWVLFNLVLILFAMTIGFYRYVIQGGAASPTVSMLMIGHAISGTVIELLGIYLILRMKNKIPDRFKVKNYKRLMQITLALWTIQALGGFLIYYDQYVATAARTTASPVALLQRGAMDLQIHADEMLAAAKRGNLATTKRHAEHVINLLSGKNSADYGDLDKDGVVEDPGDGVGLINRLQSVRDNAAKAGGNGAQADQVADNVRAQFIKILASTKTIVGLTNANDLNAVSAQLEEIAKLSDQANRGKENSIPQIATLLGESTLLPAVEPEGAQPGNVTVNLKDFTFSPKTLTVQKGAAVIFVNLDQAKHTVTADDKKFASGDIAAGKFFAFTFNDAGTIAFYCEYHGDKGGVDMAGRIVVQ